MRLIIDNLTGRTILILVLGAILVEIDIILISLLIDTENGGPLEWIIAIGVVLSGLALIGYIISRQLIKPLKTLSETAQRFSTDMQTDPLPLKGPREVRETAESFNLMQKRVQRFVEERMQLIGAISHDLRTPLTRLRLRVETLPDPEQKQKALSDIEDMSEMIQSTLSFVRDDSNKEKSARTDIASLLRTICDDTSDTFGPATYSGPDKCKIMCKPNAMKRALSNLIENAVKYGHEAIVKLTCSSTKILIMIEDKGQGIPIEESENVFLPFYRIEKSRNRETGGVGLGLSVSRTIVQSHGGEIKFDHQSGNRFIVIVDIPITADESN